jgi:hypothetical protein
MSMVPGLAEILGERLGRPVDEMQALLRSSIHQLARRRWQALTPAQIAAQQAALQRQLKRGVPEITAEDIQQIPLSQLPAFERRARDIAGRARRSWWAAYSAFQELQAQRERDLVRKGMSAKQARMEARRHKDLLAAGERSLQLKERLRLLEEIAYNASHEMEARIHLAKGGHLSDPELVFVVSQ